MSGRFVLPYPRVRIKSVAQGCKNLPPVAGLKRESNVGPTAQGILDLCAKKVYCHVLI
jgi:hypothetical protein